MDNDTIYFAIGMILWQLIYYVATLVLIDKFIDWKDNRKRNKK